MTPSEQTHIMKDSPYFYDPIPQGSLPPEEACHATRALRLGKGDTIHITDGRGNLFHATITVIDRQGCRYRIDSAATPGSLWRGYLHIAVAPTKNADRTEWLVEKAVELGVDRITLLRCRHSERTSVNTDRLTKIMVAAMKQSRKTWLPALSGGMVDFRQFIRQEHAECRLICHCRRGEKPHLASALRSGADCTVLVGPEGDFSEEEVAEAKELGFLGVSLGPSRLRTETAAMTAVVMMQMTREDIKKRVE